jgi:hypothetical protein
MLDLLLSLVLEDGRRWGDAAEPFQLDDAKALRTLRTLVRTSGRVKTPILQGCSNPGGPIAVRRPVRCAGHRDFERLDWRSRRP